jgi:dipeptidyl aminopeptidase/acylaminoacyl peptidase
MENPALAELLRAWLPPVASVEMAKRCSPLTYVRGGLPKVLHVHSRRDEVVPYEQSTRLHEALQAAGNASQLVSLDHGGHSTADWNAVDDAVGQFLNTTLVQIE